MTDVKHKDELTGRLKKLRAEVRRLSLEAFLISSPANIYYLTGFYGAFTGAYAVLIVPSTGKATLVVDSRYTQEAFRQASGVGIRTAPGAKLFETARAALGTSGKHKFPLRVESGKRPLLGFEGRVLTHYHVQKATAAFKGHKMFDASGAVESLRAMKSQSEVKGIKSAQKIADTTFKHLISIIRSGMTEKEVVWEAERFIRSQFGAELSFPMIAASGPNSSMPHASPTSRKIGKTDILKLDFGVLLNGYACDMTRTIFFGKVPQRFQQMYAIVLESQLLAIRSIKAGTKCSKIDKIARDYIDSSGYRGLFLHSLGHGIGIEVHESPVLGGSSSDTLKEGMVVSIEPGIYISGIGGVRIEDLVLVTKEGCLNLTGASKELICIR